MSSESYVSISAGESNQEWETTSQNNVGCSPCCKSFSCGRCWEFYVGGTAGALGIVVTSVGFATSSILAIVGGFVIVGVDVCCLGARIWCIKPERDLEDNVETFGEDVEEVNTQIEALKVEKQALQKVANDLQAKLGRANNLKNNLRSELLDKTDRMDKSTKKLRDVEKELKKLPGMAEKIKESTKKNKSVVSRLQGLVPIISSLFEGFSENVDELDANEDEFSEENEETKQHVKQLEAENDELKNQIAQLTTLLEEAKAQSAEKKEEIDELNENTTNLDEVGDNLKDGAEKLEGQIAKEQEINDQLRDLIDKIPDGDTTSESETSQ